MDIYQILKEDLTQILLNNYPAVDRDYINQFSVQKPKIKEHGQLSTNLCLVVSKHLQISPNEIAARLVPDIKDLEYIETVTITDTGFVNFILPNAVLQEIIKSVLSQKESYGKSSIGANIKVNVEYVSVNPTGPLHIGHARNAVYGDSLTNLLEFCGYDVTREYYINDAGNQINVLCDSIYLRYLELLGKELTNIKPGMYSGEYIVEIAKQIRQIYGDQLDESEKSREIIKEYAVDNIMQEIKSELNAINIKHDVFFSEKSLYEGDIIQSTIDKLSQMELTYTGVLEAPKSQDPSLWEQNTALLFKSEQFGDDTDKVLKKHDNAWTYFASDIAYADNKIARQFDQLIYVLGESGTCLPTNFCFRKILDFAR
jgi:arginyl-tRNA synthetase